VNRRRHIATTLVTGLLLLVFLSVACLAKKDEKPPELYIEKPSVDLGEFMEGEDIEYTFTVSNRGEGELHILNVRPG